MMDDKQLQARLDTLRQEINYHNYRYHVLDDPLISDYEFDMFMAEIREIETAHPEWVTPDSPSQRAGGSPAEKFTKVNHPALILSLANAFNADDVRAWYQRLVRLDDRVEDADFIVEPKIDGLTVVLHYLEGQFSLGATRGSGEVGEDITLNLRTINQLPLFIPVNHEGPSVPEYLIVRGEAYISIADFEELNKRLEEAGEKTYLNPRNTAAGSLRQLNPQLTATRPLKLLIYTIITSNNGLIPGTQWHTLNYLQELGFPVTDYVKYCKDLEGAIRWSESWADRRDEFPFEVDGMVIKINDLALAEDLGYVGKDPRAAIALKFPAQEVTTQLNDIGVNVGRTGVLTPYAILEPVEIGGVVVKQATLHNFDYIRDKDIRIGDRVLVKRAGDVIPYVIGPIKELRTGNEKIYKPPDVCPVCGEPVENIPGEVAWYCVNAACPEQLIRNVEHFVSRGAMDIVGLGIKIVEQLVESGLVGDVADLYSLKKADLLDLEGFADKKADNLLLAIETSKAQSLARLINALGIRGVGEVMAADLPMYYRDLDALSRTTIEDLESIEGVGPNIAQAIVDWFARPANQNVLGKIKKSGVWPTSEIEERSTRNASLLAFNGFTFVVTGTLPGFTRTQVKDFIQANGGKVTSSMSKKTTYLVVGENPGSKYAKAQGLGVELINESELRHLAEN